MNGMRFVWASVLVAGWVVAAGCEDERPVADIGVGGMSVVTVGGSAAGGEQAMGGTGVVTGGGQGGEVAQGGGGNVAVCPGVIVHAEGEDCSAFADETECSDGGTDPCEFGNSIVCRGGVWERQESFPAPCGGAGGGGAGGGGASGEGPGGAAANGGAGGV